METINSEKLFDVDIKIRIDYLKVLRSLKSIEKEDCKEILKKKLMEDMEKDVDQFIQDKLGDEILYFRDCIQEMEPQPTSDIGMLIDAGEAKKRSEIYEENYSANRNNRTKEAIGIALKNIDLNIKSSIGRGLRGVSCISNEEIREELSLILRKHGYTVDSHLIGNNRVKFTINW